MRGFVIERSETELTTHAGLAVVGQALNRLSAVPRAVEREIALRHGISHGISHGDVLNAYIGMLCLGKSDYEAVENFRDDPFFAEPLGIACWSRSPRGAARLGPRSWRTGE